MNQPKLNEQRNIEMLRAPRVSDIGMGLLLLLASRSSLMGMFPFGMSFFASCFDKSVAYIGITVISLALMTSRAGMALIKYLIAALIFWIYTRFRRRGGIIADSAACGGAMLLGGAVYGLYNFIGMYDVLLLFVEAVISSIMFIIFQKAYALVSERKKRSHASQDELISAALTAGIIITGLSGIRLPYNISLANIVSVYALLSLAQHTSLAASGSGGMCIGFMSAMSSPSAVVMTGIFGMSAMFANLLKAFGRAGIALGFLAGSCVSLLYAGTSFALPVSLAEVAAGSALFILTPKKIRTYIGTFFDYSLKTEPISSDVRLKDYLSMRLSKFSDAFISLKECFENASEKRLKAYAKDRSSLMDEAAERVCADCPNMSSCWEGDFTATYRSIMVLLETVEKTGMLSINSIPQAFRERCIRAELFTIEFNHVYELHKKNAVRRSDAVNERDIIARQYEEISEMLDTLSEEIGSVCGFCSEREEEIVNELDKEGICASEVSVIEDGLGGYEVYLEVSSGGETEKTERVLESVLEIPMKYVSDGENDIMHFSPKARYSTEIALSRVCRDGMEVSGDSAEVFTAENYKQYVIISDGMGSGKRAMTESNITVGLLKQFLLSGFGAQVAIEMINSSLCLKLDYECFSTVDLLCIDLMTGGCEFFKVGGAESVLMRGANVETVFSMSLPAGMISDIKVQPQSRKLCGGDIVIMMSDGVSEAGHGTLHTDWLKKKIKQPFDTMDDLAQSVIEGAVQKSRGEIDDDMTVAAVRLIEN
jgi:stage II sporulation protein E